MPPFGAVPYAPGAADRYDYSPGSRISEIILRAGEARAHAAEQHGQLLGSTVAGLGQVAGQAIEAQQAQKESERKSKLQDAALQSGDPRAIIHAFGWKDGPDVIKALSTLHPDVQKSYKDRMELARDTARGIRALPADKRHAAYAFARTQLIKGGVFSEEEVPPDHADDFINQLAGYGEKPPEPFSLAPREIRFGPSGEKIAEGAPGMEMADMRGLDARYAEAVATGNKELAKNLLEAKARLEAAGRAPEVSEGAPTLTPQGLDIAAKMYAQTGTLPPMGMGKEGAKVRQAIINRAAELQPDVNIALAKAGYHADTASLTKLQQQTDAVTAFENTADKNAKLLEEISKGVPDFGSRFLNKPLRSISSQLGSTQMAKFDAIRQSVQNEYARILSNPNLSGMLSDTARKETETILSSDATPGQIKAALQTLRQEARTRHTEYQLQLEVIKGRLSGTQSNDPMGIR